MVWIIHRRACSPAFESVCLPGTWESFFRIPALSSPGQGRWERSKTCGPRQISVRTQIRPVLDCQRRKENGMRTTPTHSWFRYRLCSLTDLPPAVRDVGNDRLCYRFLVSRAGRSHAFPASRSTNGPSVVLSLSLSLAVLTLCSEFTHPPRNRISSLPLSHSLRSRNPSTAHPLLWGYDGFLFDSREHQFTKFVPALGLHLC